MAPRTSKPDSPQSKSSALHEHRFSKIPNQINMKLVDLPSEILYLVCDRLSSHADLYALMTTCQTFYKIVFSSTTTFPVMLRARDNHDCLPLYPKNLLPTMAVHLIHWAAESEDQTKELTDALGRGGDDAFDRACQVTRITFAQLHNIHAEISCIPRRDVVGGAPNLVPSFVVRAIDNRHKNWIGPSDWDESTRREHEVLEALRWYFGCCNLARRRDPAIGKKLDAMQKRGIEIDFW